MWPPPESAVCVAEVLLTAGLVSREGRAPTSEGRRLSLWTGFVNPGRASFFAPFPTSSTHWNRFFIRSLELGFQRTETPGKATFLGAGFHGAGRGHQQRRSPPPGIVLRGAVVSYTVTQRGTWTPNYCSGCFPASVENPSWWFYFVTVLLSLLAPPPQHLQGVSWCLPRGHAQSARCLLPDNEVLQVSSAPLTSKPLQQPFR